MTSELKHQFDVNFKINTSQNVWNAVISKTSFPYAITNSCNHLNEETYKQSFSLLNTLLGNDYVLPSVLFDYNVTVNDTDIVVSGISEITVRVAIVDLLKQNTPGILVKMVRPAFNFRVYETKTEKVDDNVSLTGIFGEEDY
jgi:hypothetical protein